MRQMLSKDGKAASILAAFVSLIALLNCLRAEAGSPVARWVADDWTGGTANWVDRVGEKTATSYGSPVKATSQFDGSASSSGIVFDGVDDYFEVTAANNPIAGQKNVTIVALFKATQGATGTDGNHWNYPGPINAESGGNPNDFGLTIGTDGLARAFFNGAISPSTPVSVVDGAVHTMMLTWSDTDGGDGTARFYVDGVLKGSLVTDGGSGIVTDLIRFGRERETSTRWFRGAIGELRFYTTIEDPAAVHASMSGVTMNAAPTLTTVSTLTGGTEDTALTISYATLAAAANEADVDGDSLSFRIEAVSSGTLTKDGVAVTAGTTLLSSGESLVWTPAANAHGTLNAFTVKAWDGTLASASAVQVAVGISAVNDAPTIVAGATVEYTEGVRVVVESGGSALTLNGDSQYLLAGTASDHALTTGTIECWIKTGNAGWDYRGIIVKQMAFGLFLRYNQLVAYDWKDAREISTGRGLNDNAWHHVAMSFQSGVTGGTVIYLDGVAVLKTTYTVAENNVALVAGAGSDSVSDGQRFAGMIDEIRIWNSVRSAEEIANNKNSSVAANSPGLISYFKLDETSGGIALNTVSSGANGTVFGGATWTALSPPAITPSLSLSDIDDTVIATGASVSIASGYSEGDILSVPANSLLGGVSANYNDGVLTFSGTTSVNDYKAMLQAVGYNTTSDNPTALSSTRSIVYSVTDVNASNAANGTQTSTATSTVTITAVNDAPVANSQAVTTDEDIAKAIVLSASDAEGATLTYIVTSQPTKGVLSGQAPSLTYTPNANIDGSDLFTFKVNDGLADSDEVTVSITVNALNDAPSLVTPPVISRVDTVANDAFLVQSGTLVGTDVDSNTLVYGISNGTVFDGVATKVGAYGTLTVTVSTGDYVFTPNASVINALSSEASESYTVTVSDNGGLSATANLGVSITGVNDAPLLSASQGPTQATEQVAVAVDSGITVSDADHATLASATVAVSGGYQSGEDVLGYVNDPQAHGNISGSFNASTGVLTLTSVGTTATLAQWQEALRSVTYLNTSDDPNTSARTVTVAVNDGALTSPAVTKTVSVSSVNDAPSLAGITVNGTEDTTYTFTASTFTGSVYSDVENSALVSLRVETLPTSGTLKLSGTPVTAGQVIITADLANLSYMPAANENGPKTFTATVSDGLSSSSTATVTISLVSVNDAPTLTSGSTVTYLEKGAGVPIDPVLTVADVDDVSLTSATVSITSPVTGDLLSLGIQDGINAAYDATTGILSLTGSAPLSVYQAALRSVVYSSSSSNPNVGGTRLTRTIRWSVTDANDSKASNGALASIAGDAGTTYLENTVYTLSSNGSNPYIIPMDLGQNWIFEAEYRAIQLSNEGLNTLFSYGQYTDGILVRTLRGDALYLKESNFGNINVFGGTTTGEAFVPVKIQYSTSGNTGTLSVEANGVLIKSVTGAAPLNPADKTIRLGSAHHANSEGFNGQVRNIKITQGSAVNSTQSNISITSVNDAPTLTSVSVLTGGREDTALTISHAMLSAAANAADVDGDSLSFRIESVSSGTLTKGGTAVSAGTAILSSGESLVWTPAADAYGILEAFTVKAWDGQLDSTTAVSVTVSVGSVSDGQTVSFADVGSVIYGVGSVPLTASASSGLPVTLEVVSGPGRISGSSLEILGAGSVVVRASQAGDGIWDPASSVERSVTVAKRELTVTSPIVTSKAYDGTTSAVITGTLSGVMNGDDVMLVATATFASKDVGSGQVVTSTSTLSGAAAGNYRLTQPTGLTGTITSKALSIGAPTIASKVYDGTTAAGAVTVGTLIGLVGSETLTVTGTAAAYTSAAVGTYTGVAVTYTLANGGSGNTAGLASNYSLAAGSASGTITPAALLITADPSSLIQDYDGKSHAIVWSTQPAGISVEVLYGASPTPPQAAGIYEVKLSSVDPNFRGALTVTLTIRTTIGGIALTSGVVAAGLQPVSDPSARYYLEATLGQPIAGSMVVVSGIQLSSGFWFTDRLDQALNFGNVQIPNAEVAAKGIAMFQASASQSSASGTAKIQNPQFASSVRLTETRMTVVPVPYLLRVRIQISGIPGARWKVQSLDGLHSENWQDVDLLELDSNGTGSIETDAGTDSGVRFYRLVQP